MPDLLLLPRSAHKRMPWKNGGGVSEQIAISPSDGEVGAPFSMFPGCERILAVWEGEGLSLERKGQHVELDPLTLFRFSGDEAISSELTHGPVTDFNVIYDPSSVQAECEVVRGNALKTSPAERFLVCARGAATIAGRSLLPGDVLRVPQHLAPKLRAEGSAVLFDVHLLRNG